MHNKIRIGVQLLKYMRHYTIDLLFLDIELGDMTGIEVSQKIRKEDDNEHVQLVYITGKEGYERALFDFQPLNFISKPLNEEKIKECIYMAYRKQIKSDQKFFYTKRYGNCMVSMGEIASFETEGRQIVMHFTKGEEMFRSTMKKVEKQVSGNGFLRINQAVFFGIQGEQEGRAYG